MIPALVAASGASATYAAHRHRALADPGMSPRRVALICGRCESGGVAVLSFDQDRETAHFIASLDSVVLRHAASSNAGCQHRPDSRFASVEHRPTVRIERRCYFRPRRTTQSAVNRAKVNWRRSPS
jgi:hypothetical protein